MHLDTASEKPLFWVCSEIASTCVTMCKYNIPEFWWNLRSVFECGSLIGFWTRRSNMSVNHSWFGQFGVIRIRSKFSDFTLFQALAYQCGWWICICIHIVPWLERSIYFPCLWVWYRRYTCRFVFFVFCFMANRSISGLPNTCIWHIVLNITGFLSVPVCSIDLPIHSCVPECVLGPLSHCALRTSVVTSVSDCTFR